MIRWILAMAASVALAAPTVAESLADIRPGSRVKAQGSFSPGEFVLNARKLRVQHSGDDDFELTGPITRLHSETLAFRVDGVWVLPTGEDLTRSDLERVERLEVGDWVKVEGEWNRRDHLVADRVERLSSPRDETIVEGVVRHVDRSRSGRAEIDLGGVQIGVTGETKIRGPE